VDLVIVGADRAAANGDVANKIGTYLKALAARDNGVPFYVAVPGPTIDWRLADGSGIPIEERAASEVTHIPEVNAVVHVHSPHAVSLSCLRRGIPAFHYMVAAAGGKGIRCAGYATFGTQALSDAVLAALRDRRACLMANHGLVAVGASLNAALALAVEVEELCAQYWRASLMGEPVLLSDAEMDEVLERFKDYGQRGDDQAGA
jgi:hypothetical protein